MNNRSEILAGYKPRVSIYPKTHASGKVDYYVSYYLPGVKRKVARPLYCKKSEAKEFMFIHERRLMNLQFDDFDIKRIPEMYLGDLIKPRVSINKALERYILATSYNRRPATNRNTYGVLKNFCERLKVQFIDEVTPEMIQRLIGQMKSEGKEEATIYTYLALMESYYTWLIEIAQVLDHSNPFSKIQKPPRSCKISNRQIDNDTITKLLQVKDLPSNIRIPIIPLTTFLIFTGCRKGEAIHAEWKDFDLEQKIWRIREKPECPNIDSIGWKPKSNKERDVYLVPEVINLLKSLPRYNETFGSIKSDKGLVYVKADFIFSVKNNIQIDAIDDWRQTRIGNERSAWVKLCEIAGTPGIQIKDLRKYWNSYLVNTCGLSHKEAGLHIGNSNMVNFIHYTQVEYEAIRAKLEKNHNLSPQFLN